MKNTVRGFTLIELLISLTIIAVLGTLIIILINTIEAINVSKDANRISDIELIQRTLNTSLSDSSKPEAILCYNLTPPCAGFSTDANARNNDGTGWVKTDLTGQVTLTVPILPLT
jgi:prepilin-type N-terminal cleavage/methylation domain-containing protein